MSITDKRKRDLEGELTSHEPSQLRAVADSGRWLATKRRVDLAARVSLLQGAKKKGPHVKEQRS